MGEGKRSGRARASVIATTVAITAPILFLGGAVARAAESSAGGPPSVAVSYTDGSAPPVAPDSSTTTTSDDGNTGTTGNTGTNGNSLQQTIAVLIYPGQLTVTPPSESLAFAGAAGGGHLTGSLSTVRVVDARGSLVGWRATVSLQSVDGLSASQLARAELCVRPDAPTVVAGNPPEVKAGRGVCGNVGHELTLFYAPPNGGGGTFTDTGSLTLRLPGFEGTGPVSATLAVAVH